MDFLESLANPVSTKESNGDEGVEKGEKVTTTPLVQFLKDKKANKTKDAAATKAAKHSRQDSSIKSSKSKESSSTEDVKKSAKDIKKDKLIDKAAREAVKVLNREANKVAAAPISDQPKRAQPRERGSIAAAARILQRDLGLSPGNAHRKAKVDAEKAADSQTAGPSKAVPPRGRRAETDKAKDTPASATSGPIMLLKKPVEVVSAPAPAPTPTLPTAPASKPTPVARKLPVTVPSTGATKAFVKHANPSQGVTETLLKESMESFGAVSHVEIDKRKGFAYVDFVEPEGLVRAMAANPTKIAQGTVQVLERKDARPVRDPPTGPARGMFSRGGRGGGRSQRGGRGRGVDGSSNAPASAPTGPAAVSAK
jgi:regulator of nonsense transcripts 3